MDTYTTLKRAFSESNYLHSVGSGDEQTISNLVKNLQQGWMDEEEQILILTGGIAATAMIDPETARGFAEELLNGTDPEEIIAAITPRVRQELTNSFGEVQFVTQNDMVFMLTVEDGEPTEPFQITIDEDEQPTINDGDLFNWSEGWEEIS